MRREFFCCKICLLLSSQNFVAYTFDGSHEGDDSQPQVNALGVFEFLRQVSAGGGAKVAAVISTAIPQRLV